MSKVVKRNIGFEVVSKYAHLKEEGVEVEGKRLPFLMPRRATEGSAGYDFYNNSGGDIVIAPGETVKINTYIKSYMPVEVVLELLPRSSHGFQNLVRLANTVGVIDSDYYNNPDNEGLIFVKITNPERSGSTLKIPHGEAMCQGLFKGLYFTDDDAETRGGKRGGGIGSTTK